MSLKIDILVFFTILIVTLESCSHKTPIQKETIKNNFYEKEATFKIDTSCVNYKVNDCVAILDCHYLNFMQTESPFFYDKIDQINDIGKLLECAVEMVAKKNYFSEKAENILYHYYFSKYKKAHFYDESPLISGLENSQNRFYNILRKWKTQKSYEICLLYLNKNSHDSTGHGDCTNLSVQFFEEIVLPKIKTIDGMDFWTYFDKNTKDVGIGPVDCFDAFYNAMFPLLKKAWEDGNIVLVTDLQSSKYTPDKKDSMYIEKIEFDTNCITNDQFSEIEFFECYKNVLLNFTYDALNIKFYKNYGIGTLLNIAVKLAHNDSLLNYKSDEYLYSFFNTRFYYLNQPNYKYLSPMMISNQDLVNTLKIWNSNKSFEICLLYMSKNSHDSMGHGDCKNIGVKFYFNIVQPKIKSIDGGDPNTFIASHILWDNETNEKDCFDAFYNALYPLIKKAWEDGKIILVSDEAENK
ncbi:MAG: hypothetical protein IPM42_11870 [Saprospiraceae bacterium]|nr:hypothetical protein [Saprospiraceae bacterium]